jgi:hypothetical protein
MFRDSLLGYISHQQEEESYTRNNSSTGSLLPNLISASDLSQWSEDIFQRLHSLRLVTNETLGDLEMNMDILGKVGTPLPTYQTSCYLYVL